MLLRHSLGLEAEAAAVEQAVDAGHRRRPAHARPGRPRQHRRGRGGGGTRAATRRPGGLNPFPDPSSEAKRQQATPSDTERIMAKEKMTGAMAVRRALEAGGRRVRLRHAGRHHPAHLRRDVRLREAAAGAGAPRAGGRPRRRGLRPRHRQGRGLLRHLRPGRHQPGDRHRRRLHGLGAAGGHHRPTSPPASIGSDAFQEADITGITMPITKHNWLVTDVAGPAAHPQGGLLHRPHRPARPGAGRHPQGHPQHRARLRVPGLGRHPGLPPAGARGAAAQGRRHADPLRLPPGPLPGRRGAHRRRPRRGAGLRRAARRAGGHHACTARGPSPRPTRSAWACSACTARKYANYAVQGADLLIALGARFDDRVTGKLSTFAPEAKIVHLDVDPAEISKLVTATVPLVGDLKRLLPQLTEEVRRAFAAPAGGPTSSAWLKQVDGLAGEAPAPATSRSRAEVPAARSTSSRPSGRRPAARRWSPPASASTRCSPPSGGRPPAPRQFITSGGLGTMGFCLPAAIGIQLGRPGETGHRHRRRRLASR